MSRYEAIDVEVGQRVHQCPGCWSVSLLPILTDGASYECDCGERLFVIDFRDQDPSPFEPKP